jgi:urate oxidase/2-oxo-4-hydroxy-4-carboxy-5-ureidoimidazoline decarboxylase
VYRTYAKPMKRIKQIPESEFSGHENVIFALNVKIAVRGEAFLPSFTEGDNTTIVATDSMKNFILRQTAVFQGDTVEGFLYFISDQFLKKYGQMTSIEISAERIPFDSLQVAGHDGFEDSPLVYRCSRNEHASSSMEVKRSREGNVIRRHRSMLSDLQLIKVKGSSFAGFVRDEYTTLPETSDRPLFIWLNIGWEYDDLQDMLNTDNDRYVPSEQIRDIAHHVFHEMNSPSIQNLIYQIGQRILTRFPQLKEIRFESNNRTWETVVDKSAENEAAVYTEPRPPYGFQGFTMTKADLPS